jgi:alpha-amylase/alpha-mannosidase (GH57 family)
LAILWHQHQPYYPDDIGQENPMPWVRLHGTRDYWGMAQLLKETPEFHCTINLVPSLLVQLAAYTELGHEDTHLHVSKLPADGLGEHDLYFLLDNFFMVHPDHNIKPYRRYHDLYKKRGLGVDSAAKAARRFSARDIIDLQCWSNLAWMHPLAFERDRELAEFRQKGRDWTESDKQWLLAKQLQLLKEIVPLHKELSDRGQVELTTTPFYHPILPLLWDKRLARQAMPHAELPKHLESYAADAELQIRRGVEHHTKVFGRPPRGMWPSEGSVAQAILPAIVAAGMQWIATDEEILSASTEGWVSRDNNGFLRNPEMLYRPWRVEEKGQSLSIVFRDHAMSDQIGFHYQRWSAEAAVDDFVGKLEAIGKATSASAANRPALVSIVLDGENCWEYYPHSGVDFLRGLYRRVAAHPRIKSTRFDRYLEKHPPTDKIGHLFAGSWISHNFAIWIGDPEKNRAWDALHVTRQHLVSAEQSGAKSAEQIARAWEELQIAEGSDWFWWFGSTHTSAQDSVFDRLFRKHLQNVYLVLGDPPPSELSRPIAHHHPHARLYTDPTSLLNVKIDGRRTYFEWLNAGHYRVGNVRGTMSMVQEGLLSDVYFGFDTERLYLRLDARGGAVRERLADIDTLKVRFFEPAGFELVVARPSWQSPLVQLYHQEVAVSDAGVLAAADTVLEMSIPFRSLTVETDDPVHLNIELIKSGQSIELVPNEGTIETFVPAPEYELIMWQA